MRACKLCNWGFQHNVKMMKFIIDILRRKSVNTKSYHQRIAFETSMDNETVATALRHINSLATGGSGLKDLDGRDVELIAWEAGCLQKKCGACAMLINNKPALACDAFLRDYTCISKRKPGLITLAPLSKFPVIADLVTDRRSMFDNLQRIKSWIAESEGLDAGQNYDEMYEASRCLQCGCCLEVCPNFYPEGDFYGASAAVTQSRYFLNDNEKERSQHINSYRSHIYSGCGKALACQKVCPAQINIDHLVSRSNAAAVWRNKNSKILHL